MSFRSHFLRINYTNMSKSPPRHLDQTVAKWTLANDDHVLKGPEALWVAPVGKYRDTHARSYQAELIRSLPDHLLRDIGIEPPSRFQSPLEIQTRLAYNQTSWQ